MLGFIVGTACLIGLVKVLRRGRCGHALGYGGGCGNGGYGGWHGGGRHRRGWFFRSLFTRLDTTPGQEKAILSAVEELKDIARRQREELDKIRADMAAAFRSESFDESAAARASVGFEEAARQVKEATLAALRKVHESLTDSQRKQLADVLERGRAGFGGWGGPYRGNPQAWI